MSGYRVDLTKLTSLINDLDHAADEITAANNDLRQAGGRDLGTSGLDDAAEQFQQRWSQSIGTISDAAKHTSDTLGGAKKTYAELEERVATMFNSRPQEQSSSGGEQPSAIEQRLNP